MKIKTVSSDLQNMSQSGDAILKSLQNNSFSLADIIVRESIQNSLDASKPRSEQTNVDFKLGDFNARELNSELEGISERLNDLYKGQARFLSISDKNTVGLDGYYDPKYGNELFKSNFYKLVFGLGKNQENDGAGGSWGLGKTSYFCVGIGIVIYYTRVEVEDGYEERLIASLIEDPKSNARLLCDNPRGIAWWGEYHGEDNENIYPITEHESVKKILDIFGINCYKDDETGTTIIIPYLKNKFAEDSEFPWRRSEERALQTAIQRWYSPRISNDLYSEKTGNSKLMCTVNEKSLELEQPFSMIRELYTAALVGESDNKEIEIREIKIPRTAMDPTDAIVGRIAFVVKDLDDLRDKGKPYTYRQCIEDANEESASTYKMVAFARKPGMVVKYDFNGQWSERVNTEEKKCIMAFFVPNSNGILHEKNRSENCFTLEQYLRNGEKADHADWFDLSKITLLKRTKSEVSKALSDAVDGNDAERQSLVSEKLSRKFSSLLPPEGFGTSGKSGVKKSPESATKHDRSSSIVIDGTDMDEEGILLIKFVASIKKKAQVEIKIETQNQSIGQEEWSKDLDGIEFPFIIEEVSTDDISIKTDIDEKYKSKFLINSEKNEKLRVNGYLKLRILSNNYQPQLTIKHLES